MPGKGTPNRHTTVLPLLVALLMLMGPGLLHAFLQGPRGRDSRGEEDKRVNRPAQPNRGRPGRIMAAPPMSMPGALPKDRKPEQEPKRPIKQETTQKNTSETTPETTPETVPQPQTDPPKAAAQKPEKKIQKKVQKKKIQVEEIIEFSRLEAPLAAYALKRNIFSPDVMRPGKPPPKVFTPPPPPKIDKKVEEAREIQEDIEAETRRSVFYEGYVIRGSRTHALLSVNGEFFAVGVEDLVVEKIKIIKIDQEAITVEVESHTFEIQLKGDENE